MKSWPMEIGIKAPFTIGSGIITTAPAVIARIARDIPEIGFITTKTLSLLPREGYREPIIHEYHRDCFVNAVGLTNPGASQFVRDMEPYLPLHNNKPLVVSLMGETASQFLSCAQVLDPIASAFELNLSCPHVKGLGQSIGSDVDTVRTIIRLLKDNLKKPIIAKLSPNLGDIPGMAGICEEAGADGLSLINTLGPGLALDEDGNPILTNVLGGMSGAGILPIGLRAVREAAQVVRIPIIASGGISNAEHVSAYKRAGASFFSVGSALAGKTTTQIAEFFQGISGGQIGSDCTSKRVGGLNHQRPSTSYLKTTVTKNMSVGEDIALLELESGTKCRPGFFFFLRIPGIGEKPFSPMSDSPLSFLIRAVGPFTRGILQVEPGTPIFLRGPYGNGFPEPPPGHPVVLVAGGTGTAPIMMAGNRWQKNIARIFLGFSKDLSSSFQSELQRSAPRLRIVIDPPGETGEVVKHLAADLRSDRALYSNCMVFMCGPRPMTGAATALLLDTVPKGRIFIAREDVMRCGIGLCGSCGTENGLRSCVDGPVLEVQYETF
jgi:dihydroorotate dehydrogenase (NAD+) catalytic subunit